MLKTISLLLMLLAATQFLMAQEPCNGILYGKITDEHDGSPLAFANLFVLENQHGAVADIQGNYQLTGLCQGQISLVISHVACSNDTIEILVNSKKQVFNFSLEHHVLELSAVEIKENALGIENANTSKLEKQAYREASGKGMADMLESISGVRVLKTGSNISKPVIGGFSGNRVQIINGGTQMQNQNWGSEHAPEIDPFAASNYTVIRGAETVQFADGALGGIIQIEPSAWPADTGIGGQFNATYASNNRMGNASLLLHGRHEKIPQFFWRAQGSLKRSGNVRTPDYFQKNTGVSEMNYSWMMGYRSESFVLRLNYTQFNSRIGIFSGAHVGNLTDLEAAVDREMPREEDRSGFTYEIERPFQLVAHELIAADAKWYGKSHGDLQIKLSRQFNIREEFDKEKPRNAELAALDIPEFSVSLESYTGEINWEKSSSWGLKSKLGFQSILKDNRLNSFTDFIPDYQSQQFSFFLIEEYRWSSMLFSLGLRQTHLKNQVQKFVSRESVDFENDFELSSIVLGIGRELGAHWNLKMNLSSSERAPSMNELYSDGLHHGSASLEFGDDSLSEERALGISFQASAQYENTLFELNARQQWISDFIYLNPTGVDLTIRGAYPSFQWKNTEAQVLGLDGRIRHSFTRHWSLQYTWDLIWAENTSENRYLPFIPSNRMEARADYAFSSGSKWVQGLVIGLGNQWVFQQTRFNPGEELADPPEGYELLFANLSWPIPLNKNNLNINLRAENLLDVKYREYMNRFRYFTDEAGRNLRFSLQYEF